jgi:phosphatidylcholine synthase
MMRRVLIEAKNDIEVELLSDRECRHRHLLGLAIHAITASGTIAGLLGLQAVMEGHVRAALLWLIVCQVLDGIDGPIARKIDVVRHAPRIDGHILDLVVDYVACVVVPVAFMIKMNLLPSAWQIWIAALIIFTSALWFARNDQETSDNWFNGFPATWNVVVPTFLILGTSPRAAVVISILLCALQLTSVKFPHLMRVQSMRRLTITMSIIYLVALTYLSATYPNGPRWAYLVLMVAPIYLVGLVVWRTWFPTRRWFGLDPIGAYEK